MYNVKHLAKLKAHPELPTCVGKIFEEIDLGETTINISGKECKVKVTRNKSGLIEIEPIDEGILSEGGWLFEGTCTEGYNFEVIISQFNY